MGKLDGRVVLITGAARGQGEQEARLFAAEGARVVVADVLDEQGEELAEEIGASYVHLDVGREEDWTAAVASAKAAHGRIDGLVNNAGILRFNALVDTPLAEFLRIVQVNQVGVFLGIKTLAPEIAAAGGGTIVNTASFTGLTGMAYVGARVVYNLGTEVRRARELGSYRLEEKLGRGGMGEVWRARHRMLARPAAIKLIRPSAGGSSCSATPSACGPSSRRNSHDRTA